MDNAPAGDPTYDPYGTSRPFRPTHKIHASRKRAKGPSYLDIDRRNTSSENPLGKIAMAVRQNVQYRFDGSIPLPFENLRNAGYGGAAVIGAICVLFIGASLLSEAFPLNSRGVSVTAQPTAATADDPNTTSDNTKNSSSQLSKPTSTDAAVATEPLFKNGEAGVPMVDGISDSTMQLYVKAAHTCNMPWQILAAVGGVETNHGTSTAPGVNDGQNFAGAKGPMQFMQSTWDKYGLDANHDGKADIYNQTDAIYSAASYLCANGAGTDSDINNALLHYNHSDSYVQLVRQTAASYYDNAYVLPIPPGSATAADLGRSHHDYPADDIPIAQGTPVFAVHKGTVHLVNNDMCGYGIELTATDGVRYTYCHASQLNVSDGATVDAGELIMHSGGEPGTAGAGDASGPHLHFQISVNGQNVCPQGLLQKWLDGTFTSPQDAPSTGCTH